MEIKKCENCGSEHIHVITKEIGYSCSKCGRNTVRLNEMHQTNADRIRSFSDEELSKFIGKFLESMSDCENCPAKTEAFLCVDCADEILDWLRKEVEE